MTTVVWIAPSATSYACLCEPCLEQARRDGVLFSDALLRASVRGTVAAEAESVTARCRAGHELLLRRGDRPPALSRRDGKQLQLT